MKILTISILTGLSFAVPVAASAQSDNSAALASSARYCAALARDYTSVHQNAVLPDGTSDQAVYCESDPVGGVAHIAARMRDENIPLPPRP
jgi:hypothetical protein